MELEKNNQVFEKFINNNEKMFKRKKCTALYTKLQRRSRTRNINSKVKESNFFFNLSAVCEKIMNFQTSCCYLRKL